MVLEVSNMRIGPSRRGSDVDMRAKGSRVNTGDPFPCVGESSRNRRSVRIQAGRGWESERSIRAEKRVTIVERRGLAFKGQVRRSKSASDWREPSNLNEAFSRSRRLEMPKRTRACPAGVLGGRKHQPPCPKAGCRESVRRETNKPNACRRQEKPGEMLLGHRSYPNAKAHGDQSMIEKRETGELARPAVPQGPRDRVKVALLEPQPPGMELHILRHGRYGRSRRDRAVRFSPPEISSRRTTANEAVQGDEPGTYVALGRSARRDTGSPKGREAQGDGAAVVVRGRESRPHGEGPQVRDGHRGR